LSRIDVLHAGKAFDSNHMVHQTKVDGMTAYEKLPHFQPYRDAILKAAKSKAKRQAIPTKRNPAGSGSTSRSVMTIKVRLPRSRNQAVHTTIDDTASFSKARKVRAGLPYVKISETTFKNGVAKILGEHGSFKDWGGELRDLSSTRLLIDGKRRAAAFAFKGP